MTYIGGLEALLKATQWLNKIQSTCTVIYKTET